jgi:hypothetical protein
MTDRDIQLTRIVKTKFKSDNWSVTVIDENDFIYEVNFSGSTEDTDSLILENTYNELLNVEKKQLIIPPVDVTRDTIIGSTPVVKPE